jgi:hypothetical protein
VFYGLLIVKEVTSKPRTSTSGAYLLNSSGIGGPVGQPARASLPVINLMFQYSNNWVAVAKQERDRFVLAYPPILSLITAIGYFLLSDSKLAAFCRGFMPGVFCDEDWGLLQFRTGAQPRVEQS